MVKKVVSLIVGFGLIAAGAAGITISLAERDRQAAMQELETVRQANLAKMAEERKVIEEKQQEVAVKRQEVEGRRLEIETLAKSVEAEKKRLQAEHRAQEEHLKYKAAVIEEEKKAASEKKSAAVTAQVREKLAGKKNATKPIIVSEKAKTQKKATTANNRSSRIVTAEASSLNKKAEPINGIGRKAGREAARLFEPVEYYNRSTRELLRAEPYDRGRDWVRVRIRIWRDDRLVKDSVVSFAGNSLNGPSRSRG